MATSARDSAHPHDDRPESSTSQPSLKSPTRTLVLVVAALAFGSLLNAQSLSDSAHARRPGWQRDLAVAITDPVLDVSSAMRLDRPAAWIADIRFGDDEEPPPPTAGPPSRFEPTPDRPVQLWVTGDSLTNTLGPALVELSAGTGVVDPDHETVYSSGLTRPDFFDWRAHVARELAASPAGIVVFMVGANDGQPILTDDGWVTTQAEAWQVEYRIRVAALMDEFAGRATNTYWIGQPITRSEDHAAHVARLNAIFELEASGRDRVRYIDSWELFTDENGAFTAFLPDASGKDELVRADDGVHLTPAGANRLAREILDIVRDDWKIPE